MRLHEHQIGAHSLVLESKTLYFAYGSLIGIALHREHQAFFVRRPKGKPAQIAQTFKNGLPMEYAITASDSTFIETLAQKL
jgi:hypothetical protein